MVWNGETVDSTRARIRIRASDDQLDLGTSQLYSRLMGDELPHADVTNEWIQVAAGARRSTQATMPDELALRDPRRVMVVHGRNRQAREAMFTFLRAIGLGPIEWEEAIAETGLGPPHNLEAVRVAMGVAQAVVVLLTAEDQARLMPALADGVDDEGAILRGQPRQNVILEAGMAFGVAPNRTILVELGAIRRASDFDGLNVVRLTNAPPDSGTDWLSSPAGGDFEGSLVS